MLELQHIRSYLHVKRALWIWYKGDIVPSSNKQRWGTVSYSSQLSHWTQTRALNTDGNAMLPQFL